MTTLTCPVCPHHCRLNPGTTGLCRARANQNDQLVCLNYGLLTSLALDPIEKKPLARFHPGSQILSVGSFGCNFHCPFCQNHEISMAGLQTYNLSRISPEQLAAQAFQLKPRGNLGLAYTYNEPLISYEFILDTGKLIHEARLLNVVVTNGGACVEIARLLKGTVDAYNIDLKGFTQKFYDQLGGNLAAVQAFIQEALTYAHVELTTLIIPGENDTAEEMEHLSAWVASLSPEIPLHVSRFFPRYLKQDLPATPVDRVYQLAALARKRLRYVYTGNC